MGEMITKDKIIAETVKELCENILEDNDENQNVERIKMIVNLCNGFLTVVEESRKPKSKKKLMERK